MTVNKDLKSSEIPINDATPMLRQYIEIKKQHQDTILFYRMGDFYETFLEDAVLASKELEITLTGREAGKIGRIPMAGVPVKAVDNYIKKLIEKGFRVAVCEQTEDPLLAKGLVERQVVRTITAGTLTEENLLDSSKNNYLAAVYKPQKEKGDFWGLAYTDVSTGEFRVSVLDYNSLLSELDRIAPAEIIAPLKKLEIKPFQVVPEEEPDLPNEILKNYNCIKRNPRSFNETSAIDAIKRIFKLTTIESFGYPKYAAGLCCAGAILNYLEETQNNAMPDFDIIVPYSLDNFLSIDANTRKNLELTETSREKAYKGSVLWSINRTSTNMGTRLLRKWILQPLCDLRNITLRQDAVEELLNTAKIRGEISSLLKKVSDIERLSSRISNNSANARDFSALKDTLKLLPEFAKLLESFNSPYLSVFSSGNKRLTDFANIIEATIATDPAAGLREGNIIRNGVNQELDRLRDLLQNGRQWLESFEEQERKNTGIKSLKIGYSKTFGYFIEVSHANSSLVPEYFIRKQTLVNAERYITPELKNHESEVLNAETRLIEIEYKIFCDLRDYAKEFVPYIRDTAKSLALLDVLISFADIAAEYNYTKPIVDNSDKITIVQGRHCVVEQLLPLGHYVPNCLDISAGNCKTDNDYNFMILTGPNMAGKSTYMRQNALIVILSQIGSYVPAKHAHIGLVDKIFTRVGSVDDISVGQSTFMVEMSETAFILNHATERSFILLDEIGRGTSTYDGVAIAWSVAEYISQKIKARTIFATHYHELNIMQEQFRQVANYQITVSEKDGEIEFLRQVVPGGTNRSYGIQVAKMAGLPNSVIKRAQSLMHRMQKDYTAKLPAGKSQNSEIEINTPQLSLFE